MAQIQGLAVHAAGAELLPFRYDAGKLESQEVFSLVAYLEDVDQHAAEDTSPLRFKVLLAGLGGAVLGLAAFSALWGSRARARGKAAPVATTPSQQVQ